MRKLVRLVAFVLGPSLLLAGCLDLQGSYSSAARDQCREIIDVDERMECLRWVAENDTARRAEQRRRDGDQNSSDIIAAN